MAHSESHWHTPFSCLDLRLTRLFLHAGAVRVRLHCFQHSPDPAGCCNRDLVVSDCETPQRRTCLLLYDGILAVSSHALNDGGRVGLCIEALVSLCLEALELRQEGGCVAADLLLLSCFLALLRQHTAAYVSMRQHTS